MRVIRDGFFSYVAVTKVRIPAGEQLLLDCSSKQYQPIHISVWFWHVTNTARMKQMFCFKADFFFKYIIYLT